MTSDDSNFDALTRPMCDATVDQVPEPLREQAPQRRISLVLVHRNGVRTVPLSQGQPVTIGRAPPVDILIQDSTLSRQHARFDLVNDRVIVEDLDSTNGIWMDDEQIRRHALRLGDEVTMGRILVSVQLLDPSQSPMHRLISHDQFVVMLEEEVSKARSLESRLAVLHVQASPGGATAGQWLHALSQFLRPIDKIALYSNTAVLIFLPNAAEAEARHLADQILQQTGSVDQPDPRLRFGISTYPDSSSTADEMLQSSRRAVRRATDRERVQMTAPHRFRKLKDSDQMLPISMPGPVVGSPAMKEVFGAVARLAQTDIPVLLMGETGTGKEVVARAIHQRSRRQDRGLCCINCASIPDQLVESTLFGHVRGAFTGADRDAKGVFEEAEGGTVLLDEVAELPLLTQAKLLRVIETKQFSRVGSAKERSMDVRIIAATHRDLEQMCQTGQFRWDLFYRINTMTLRVPPLRERREEISLLVNYFIVQAVQDSDFKISSVTPDALKLLESYYWPGNVRELRNVIERAVVLAQEETITMEDLPERVRLYQARGGEEDHSHDRERQSRPHEPKQTIRSMPVAPDPNASEPLDFRSQMLRYEAELIMDALQQTDGNQTEAAKLLDLPLRTLVRKIKTHGLQASREQKPQDEGDGG